MTDVRALHNQHANQARSLANTGRAGATDAASANADASGGEFAGLFGQIADAAASTAPGKTAAATTNAVAIAADGAMPVPAPVCVVTDIKAPNVKTANVKTKPVTDDPAAAVEVADATPDTTTQDKDAPALDAPRKPRKGEDKADLSAAQPDQAPPAMPTAPPAMVLAPPPVAQPAVTTTPTTQPSAAAIAAVAAPAAVAAATPAPGATPAQAPVDQPATEAEAQVAAVTIDPAAGRKAPAKTARDRANDDQGGKSASIMTSAEKRAAAAADATVHAATSDDAASPREGAFQLSDFVQSLPPVLQAQLGGESVAPIGAADSSSTSPTASTADQLGDQVIDMGVSGQWIDRMAREIAGLADGSGYSRFQLNPPHLGRIQVDLWQGDSGTNLRMTTETDEAAKRLRDGQSSLATDARVAALSLSSVTVEKASAPFDSGREQQGQRQPSDFMGQAQQQAAGQQGQGSNQSGGLNRTATAAVIGRDQDIRSTTTDSASTVDGRRVRYA